jgi:hypothetical protein
MAIRGIHVSLSFLKYLAKRARSDGSLLVCSRFSDVSLLECLIREEKKRVKVVSWCGVTYRHCAERGHL